MPKNNPKITLILFTTGAPHEAFRPVIDIISSLKDTLEHTFWRSKMILRSLRALFHRGEMMAQEALRRISNSPRPHLLHTTSTHPTPVARQIKPGKLHPIHTGDRDRPTSKIFMRGMPPRSGSAVVFTRCWRSMVECHTSESNKCSSCSLLIQISRPSHLWSRLWVFLLGAQLRTLATHGQIRVCCVFLECSWYVQCVCDLLLFVSDSQCVWVLCRWCCALLLLPIRLIDCCDLHVFRRFWKMVLFKIVKQQTKPIDGQKPGTSGLRKKVRVLSHVVCKTYFFSRMVLHEVVRIEIFFSFLRWP